MPTCHASQVASGIPFQQFSVGESKDRHQLVLKAETERRYLFVRDEGRRACHWGQHLTYRRWDRSRLRVPIYLDFIRKFPGSVFFFRPISGTKNGRGQLTAMNRCSVRASHRSQAVERKQAIATSKDRKRRTEAFVS